MERAFTYDPPLRKSGANGPAGRGTDITPKAALDAFERKDFRGAFHALLDYVNPAFRRKYGNAAGTEFRIPHRGILTEIRPADGRLAISAPFLRIPAGGSTPLLHAAADLNVNGLDLAQLSLRDGKLLFGYECPEELAHPYKIYAVLEEICRTADRYGNDFAVQYGAEPVYTPVVAPYAPQVVRAAGDILYRNCGECLAALEGLNVSGDSSGGYAWHILACTLLKTAYSPGLQGNLKAELDNRIAEMYRDDLPLPEILASAKAYVERLLLLSSAELADNSYEEQIFIPAKRRIHPANARRFLAEGAEQTEAACTRGESASAGLTAVYNFYNLYYFNEVPGNLDALIADALERSSARPWNEAAPILCEALQRIVNGDFGPRTVTQNLSGK